MPEENQSESGFVKEKTKASNPKNRGKSRARATRAEKIIRRATKKLAEALEFADHDVAVAMEVLRDQMLNSPFPKIRQDAAVAILAYKWGRPTEKRIVATGDFEDLQALMNAVRETQIGREKFPDDS